MAQAVVRPAAVENQAERPKTAATVREFGLLGIATFALASIGLMYSGLLPYSVIAGLAPGADLAWVVSIAALAALVHAFTYAAIGAAVRRNGADYYLASRVISPPLAFASSFLLVIFFAVAGGTLAAVIPQSILPMFIRSFALITKDSLLLDWITVLNTPSGVVMWGTLGVVIVFGSLLMPPHQAKRWLMMAMLLVLLAWAVIYQQFGAAEPGSFSTRWNEYIGEGSYLDHLYQARRLGVEPNATPGLALFAGLAFGFWLFYGYFNGTYMAGEVQQPGKNLLLGSWLAVAVGWLVLFLTALLVQYHIPLEWLASESYLSLTPGLTGQAMPWVVFYAAVLNPSAFLVILMGLLWVFGLLALVYTFLYAGSRVILAWAEDGLFPPQFAVVHPVLRSPLLAVLLMCTVAVLGVLGVAFRENLTSANPILIMAASQVLPVLALILLPFRCKECFNSAPPMVRWKLGPLPVISLVGLLSLVYLVWMLVVAVTRPELGGLDQESLWVLGGSLLFGLLWYFGRQVYLKVRRLKADFSWQPPPEESTGPRLD